MIPCDLARFERPSGRVDTIDVYRGVFGDLLLHIRSVKASGSHLQLVFTEDDLPALRAALDAFERQLRERVEPPPTPPRRAPAPVHRPGVPRGRVTP